jgi:hypothetical protein
MPRFDVSVTKHGPLFDGRAAKAVRDFRDAAEEEIAQEGVNILHGELARVLRNPTGYYESQIQTDRASGDWRVHDGDVVYGPWLAGVGSRNATTRFRGYAHWRRATQRIDRLAKATAERILPRYTDRMNR